MKYWLNLTFQPADQLLALARMAEDLGFEGVYMGEHVLLPTEYTSDYPSGRAAQPAPEEHFPDPWTAFGMMAAATTRLRFLTDIFILPLRDPFTVAKDIGTAAFMSGNRIVLGAGVGWNQEEYGVVGADWKTRGRRADEMLAIMRDLWEDGYAEYHGEFYDFDRIGMFPHPTEHVPVWIGGRADSVLKRAARHDGFIPQSESVAAEPAVLEGLKQRIDDLRAAEGRVGPFEYVYPWIGPLEPETGHALVERGATILKVPAWELRDRSLGVAEKTEAAERFVRRVMDDL